MYIFLADPVHTHTHTHTHKCVSSYYRYRGSSVRLLTRLWIGQLENGSSVRGRTECSLDHRVHAGFTSKAVCYPRNDSYPLKRVINTHLLPGWGSHRAIVDGLQKGIFAGSSREANSYPLSLACSLICSYTDSRSK